MATEADSPANDQDLGRLGSTRVSLVVGTRPWATGVDMLAISVGPRVTGGLGRSLIAAHREIELPETLLASVSRDLPRVVQLPQWRAHDEDENSLKALLLVTLHTSGREPSPEEAVQNSTHAVRAAVRVAAREGGQRLGLPLLGAGSIGAERGPAADALVRGLREGLSRASRLAAVVLLVQDAEEAEAITASWHSSASEFPPSAVDLSGDDDADQPRVATTEHPLAPQQQELSGSAWRLLRRAAGSVAVRVDDDAVWVAAFQEAPVSQWMRARLGLDDASVAVPGRSSAEAFEGSNDELFAIAGVAEVTARAQGIATQTSGSAAVHARHLMAAAVTGALSQAQLDGLGVTSEQLREHLAAAIRESVPFEWGPKWQEVLSSGLLGVLAGGVSADLVRPDLGLQASDDHLDFSTYVSMMATLVARADTPLPLSIGLFGEWGSGKSTFMGLLRGRVDELSASGSPDYLRDVEQIGFNAWTYADANLWASLGDEIFRALIGPEATDDDVRRTVRDELGSKLARADELAAARDHAVSEAASLQNELDRARAAHIVSLSALGRAAGSAALSKVWSALKVTDVGEQGQLLADEVRSGAQQAQTLKRTLKHPQSVVAIALLLVSLCVVGVGLALPTVRGEISILGAAGCLAGLLWLGQVARGVRKAMATLASTAADIRARLQGQADEHVAPELREVGLAEGRVKVVQAQLDEVLVSAGELRRQLVDLEPGRRLYAFINERAASGDYRGQLGLVSTIRRDFVRLRDAILTWRANHDDAERGIDRIVLYIDDLDRCSPRQVVEVLQAVHLLLALDLFVVVVGVDPRWLLHSLREEYRQVLVPDAHSGRNEEWLSTPSDYVEKIFNVPFVLPGMTTQTFDSLVRGLGISAGAAPPTTPGELSSRAPTMNEPGESPKADTGTKPAAVGVDTPLLTAEPASEVADAVAAADNSTALPPQSRPITEVELDLIAALAPLVQTPRQAKRMLNIYRMLRSTQDLGDASTWLGDESTPGHHQAVALMLGLLTYDARLLGELLHGRGGVCVAATNRTWQQVLATLVSSDPHGWSDASVRLAAATALVTLPDVAAFKTWGPHVARFSFVLSPAAKRGEQLPAS
jgi:hypothetical protein